jgi:hypothetical protein
MSILELAESGNKQAAATSAAVKSKGGVASSSGSSLDEGMLADAAMIRTIQGYYMS